MKKNRLMYDLFCGLGGASAAFVDAGWDVVTVDSDPMFKPTILTDIRDLVAHPEGVPLINVARPDFLWASPPCIEFARRRFDPSINPSLDLVIAAKKVIDELRPRYWCIENVRLSVPHISKVLGPHRVAIGPYFLWGNFPMFLPRWVREKGSVRGPHWLRSALRAKIPYAISSDMERAVSYVMNAEEARAASCPATWPAAGAVGAPLRAPQDLPAAGAVGAPLRAPQDLPAPGPEARA
jgi:hypothetical protein